MRAIADPLGQYVRCVETLDVHGASGLVLKLLDEGLPLAEIATEVLAPAQLRVGRLWEEGRWSVADEHAATLVTEVALSALVSAAPPRRGAESLHVALACAEGEWHSLPARMAAAVAGAAGDVRVTVLGPSLPAGQLRHRLSAGDVDVLALSCTMPTNLIGAARCIAAAHDVEVPVVVGGRAFGGSVHRAESIGADAWAVDAAVLAGPPPELSGRPSVIPTEVLLLDSVDDVLISAAYDRIVDEFPRLAAMDPFQQARTREDLTWMARFTAGALLTDDPSVVTDLLLWMSGLLAGRVPASVITRSAQLLADTIEGQLPSGAALLHHAAAETILDSRAAV